MPETQMVGEDRSLRNIFQCSTLIRDYLEPRAFPHRTQANWVSAHSLTTPSEGYSFSTCDGRGPTLPDAACNHLFWAGWASLGGGEVGQLVAMVTAAAPCQLSHLFTTNLTG